jgi:integrase
MSGIEVSDPIHPSEKRAPFTTAQLNQLFATDPWKRPFDPDDPNPSRYWAPLIGLYSGARLTDICGQLVEEMIELDGVKVFHFAHRPGERQIKGGRSRRVPVHPDLIALGFWDFVEAARASGRQQLFPEVKRDQVGKWGDNTSKWFSRKIAGLGLRGRSLSFHSLRHDFEDALRRVDLHDTPVGNALAGRWSGSGSSQNYGTKYPMDKLKAAIELVSYPGLALAIPRIAAGS